MIAKIISSYVTLGSKSRFQWNRKIYVKTDRESDHKQEECQQNCLFPLRLSNRWYVCRLWPHLLFARLVIESAKPTAKTFDLWFSILQIFVGFRVFALSVHDSHHNISDLQVFCSVVFESVVVCSLFLIKSSPISGSNQLLEASNE